MQNKIMSRIITIISNPFQNAEENEEKCRQTIATMPTRLAVKLKVRTTRGLKREAGLAFCHVKS